MTSGPVSIFLYLLVPTSLWQLEDLESYTANWSTQLVDLDLRGCINLPELALTSVAKRFTGLTRLSLQEAYNSLRDGCALRFQVT